MFDRRLRRWIDPLLEQPATLLARRGVSANAVTLGGLAFGLTACLALSQQNYFAALALIGMNRLCDGLDGAVARRSATTAVGGFLDSVCDSIFYSAVPLAFAIGRPETAFPALVLVQSFMGTTGSFLAFAALAARRGTPDAWEGKKSFYYHFGLMEGGETIGFFVAFCLFPDLFATLAYPFAALCWLTTAIRVTTGIKLL